MNSFSKIKQLTLLLGDIVILYVSLIITLALRYGNLFYFQLFAWHIEPFTIVFAVWLAIFYIAGLYDLKSLKNDLVFVKTFGYAIFSGAAVAILFFYLIPSFLITPRANLFIFTLIFSIFGYLWRRFFNNFLNKAEAASRILLIGTSKTAEELTSHLEKNPQLGYKIQFWMKEGLADKEFEHLSQIILAHKINTIVLPAHLKKDSRATKIIYKTLLMGVEIMELATLYEQVFQKVPLAELEEVWFLENLVKRHKIYELLLNPIERTAALFLLLLLLPLEILIAIIIKISSPGPVIFRQQRIGQNETEFTIYKFRTMPVDAEKEGPRWANYHQDSRATWFGKVLRWSHLDELPQLINVIKGDLSFVGPRPERPEFVAQLKKELPYYDLRHITKPGITGWAQINFRYAASAMDSYQKLQYDIYYIKNNSPFLDLEIILKTIKFLISNL
jgi:exopolysaccharide biosynthesis polyprenyl glycosylphosphotransferase